MNQAFLPIFLGQLREEDAIEAIFRAMVKGSAGPQLRGDAFFAHDEIFLSNFVDAFVQAGIPWSVQREISGTAFTRFSLTTTTNAAGFARLTVPYITSWTDHLPTTPWEAGESVAQSISRANALPAAFPKALRDAMLFPVFTSIGAVAPCSPASNPAEGSAPDQVGVVDCARWFAENDLAPPGMQSHFAGPERGCYPRSAFASAWNGVLPPSANGICGTRLQARNVNVLPEGLQIVILDQGLQDPTPDDMARFVTWLPGSVNPLLQTQSVTIDCNPSTPPTPPRMHLVDPRSITLEHGVNAACGLSMTPACGSL